MKRLSLLPGDPNYGVSMIIVLKRRILSALMTIYLPTIVIILIVHATNFFKHFFFEAFVTVNLTSLLVLTTLFISVSGEQNLPNKFIISLTIMIFSSKKYNNLCSLFVDVQEAFPPQPTSRWLTSGLSGPSWSRSSR